MLNKTITLVIGLLTLSFASIGQCNPPVNVTLFTDEYNFTSFLDWWPPTGGCGVITYEIEYGYGPFTPGTGEGISYGFQEWPIAEFFDPYVTHAWIRSICDCEGGDEPGEGDGEPDTEGGWVEATLFIIPPPIFPDLGLYCVDAPNVNVFSAFACGSGYYDMYFISLFEWEGLFDIPCGDGSEYVLWRTFTAPIGGIVEVHYSSDSWDELGYAVYDGGCDGDLVTCVPSVESGTMTEVGDLIAGQTYHMAFWNVNYPYYEDEWGYNGTVNFLYICEPAVDCYPPSNVVINNISNESAYVSWNSNEATLWNLEYGPAGFTPGEGTLISGISTDYIWLDELNPETEYDVYIEADCEALGNSILTGPHNFATNPSIWVEQDIADDYAFCCDSYELAETFEAFTYCEPLIYTFDDIVEGEECDQLITRTVTAVDDCGNEVSVSFDFNIYDNSLDCGCESAYQIPDNANGRAVAIHGDWAIQENGMGDRVMHYIDGEWTLSDPLILGTNFHHTLQMHGDAFVSLNNVYRLEGESWLLEQSLVSSLGDEAATVSSIYENTVALEMNSKIFLFEWNGEAWEEVALFDQSCISLDLGNDVLVASHLLEESIASVFRRVDGIWAWEQDLAPPPDMEGAEMGYEVAVDGTHIAIGARYLGGICLYEFDGVEWQSEGFMMNPNIYSEFGYYTGFGSAIDIDGNLLVVGDNMNQPNGSFSGTVTIFERSCNEWVFQKEIVPVDGSSGERFGGCLDYHNGTLLTGIDDTYWLGGYPYNDQGKFWFIPCIEEELQSLEFSVSPGSELSCNDTLPEPVFEIGGAWCEGYEITEEIDGELACGSELVRTYTINMGEEIQTATQVFTMIDDEAPSVLSEPADEEITCNEQFMEDPPVFTDNCTDSLSIDLVWEVNDSTSCAFVQTLTWTATDDCGNQTVVQKVEAIIDDEGPDFECPEKTMFYVISESEVFLTPDFVEGITDLEDICDDDPQLSQSPEVGEPLPAGEHVITLVASDECGNETICEVDIVVELNSTTNETPEPQLSVYPIPVQKVLFVDSDAPIEMMEVVNGNGKRVIQTRRTQTLDVSQLAAGIYILRAFGGQGEIYMARFVKD